jgi:hypothetical protein
MTTEVTPMVSSKVGNTEVKIPILAVQEVRVDQEALTASVA